MKRPVVLIVGAAATAFVLAAAGASAHTAWLTVAKSVTSHAATFADEASGARTESPDVDESPDAKATPSPEPTERPEPTQAPEPAENEQEPAENEDQHADGTGANEDGGDSGKHHDGGDDTGGGRASD
jgi:hypothetical protein